MIYKNKNKFVFLFGGCLLGGALSFIYSIILLASRLQSINAGMCSFLYFYISKFILFYYPGCGIALLVWKHRNKKVG